MSTWGQLRFQLATAAPGVSLDLLDSFLNTRYEQVLSKCNWTGVTYHYNLITEAAYQSASDTVSVTVGSSVVTGTGTTWSSALVGKRFYIPGDTSFYTVSAFTSTTSLTLDRAYEGRGADASGTVYAGSSYVLMQHIYAMPPDVRTVVTALNPLTNLPLKQFSKIQLDQTAGARTLVADPECFAVYDDSDEGAPPVLHQLEVFPPPLYRRAIPVEYTHVASGFDGGSTDLAPFPWVGDAVLLYGCQSDISMHLSRHAESPGAAAGHRADAKNYEGKYMEALGQLLKNEYVQRRAMTPFGLAPRFTRHRLERAARGFANNWGAGQGGPN